MQCALDRAARSSARASAALPARASPARAQSGPTRRPVHRGHAALCRHQRVHRHVRTPESQRTGRGRRDHDDRESLFRQDALHLGEARRSADQLWGRCAAGAVHRAGECQPGGGRRADDAGCHGRSGRDHHFAGNVSASDENRPAPRLFLCRTVGHIAQHGVRLVWRRCERHCRDRSGRQRRTSPA